MYNHQLDAFVRTADLGSFSRAAKALYISTPSLVQQVNLLEDRVGFRLFERSNRGVVLTAAGKSLYEDSKTIIRLSNEAVRKARSLAESSETTVRVGTSLLFKCRMLPDIWSRISAVRTGAENRDPADAGEAERTVSLTLGKNTIFARVFSVRSVKKTGAVSWS